MPCEPPVVPPAGESAYSTLPDGVPPLRTLYLYVAGACNLACSHCWISPSFDPSASSGKFLALDHARKAVTQAIPLGLASVKLTGGEPMLHPRFRDLVGLASDEGLGINIETNGTLVDDSIARFLMGRKVSFISVSLDGAEAATHDALRGVAGSFDKAVSGIKALVDAGFKPQAICTLHRGNAHQMADVISLAQSLGCGSVKFNHLQTMGRGVTMKGRAGLDPEKVLALYRDMERTIAPSCPIRLSYDIPFAFRTIGSLLKSGTERCGILNILGVLSGGELSLCGVGVNVPELIYGHLASDEVADVWCHAPGLSELRRLVPEHLEGICGRCVHRDLCLAECVAQVYFEENRINGPCPFCAWMEQKGIFPESRLREGSTPASQGGI